MSDALDVVIDEVVVPGGHVDRRALAIAVAERLDDLLAGPLAAGLPLEHRGDDATIRVEATAPAVDRFTDPSGLASELARVIVLAITGPGR